MLPGPELDAEIARKVLGAIVLVDTETGGYQVRDLDAKRFVAVPPYSTDTTVAHRLVSLYKNAGCTFSIKAEDDSTWSVTIAHQKLTGINFTMKGQTLPHAICNAILQFNGLFKIG